MENILLQAIFLICIIITMVLGAMMFTGKYMPFIAWVALIFIIHPFISKAEDKKTTELIDGVNSGKYDMIDSDDVRQIRGEYFKVGEDGKLTHIDSDDIEHVSEDGTIYVKPNSENTR